MVDTRRRSAASIPAGKRPPRSAASIRGKKRPPPSAASIRGKKRPPPSAASVRGKKRPKVRSFPTPPPLHAADPPTGAFASLPERISTAPRGRGTAETELPRNLRAQSSQTTSADASSIAAASILASLSVLENNLAVPLMASNVKNVQQGRDIPSLPSGCDASGICSPDNDTNCRIGKEYTTSEFDLGENVFKVCKDHREIPQNLGAPTLPSPGCQAFNDAFEPGICSTSDIQASVDTHRRLTSSTSCQTEGTSKKDAKKKMPLSFINQGVVVGDNVNKWYTRAGHFIQSYVPIDITDFRRTPQKFLDDVWNALKEEFDFGSVDPKIVRESLELRHSQRFRTMKVKFRNEILRKAASVQEAIEACPNGFDRGHWENFVKREFKPEVIAANLRNKTNKQKSSIDHTLGRHNCAQINHSRKHPEKEICRTEDWLRAHEKPDGIPLDRAKEKYATSADASSINVASILASLSVLENNLAVPLMASNVKNVQQGRDIPSLPSGCDASGICSPDNDTNCRIGKEYTTSEFDLGENVFKACKDHKEIPQNLGSPTLPSPGCQAFNDAFEPGICSTSDIQASVDTHRRITSSTSCQTEGTSKKDAKKKIPLSFTNQGVIVGENAAKWNTRVGYFVRSYVPIDITDFTKTPQNFLDDVWNASKEEFDFGSVDPKIVRESLELGYSQRFQTMKVTLRDEILRKAASVQEAIEACPIGIDPGHWENFVNHEFKSEVIAANLKNKTNKQKSSIGHTLGRRTHAQNNHIRQHKHPEKEICRTEDLLRTHEKPDGTPLDSAKEKYLLVQEAQNKRKNTSMSEGNSSTHVDLDSDELTEVFGRDTRGRVRDVGSNISRKQVLPSVVTSSIVEEKNSSTYRDLKTDVAELKTTISRVEDMMTAMYRWQCASLRQEVPDRQNSDVDMIPRTETGSRFINKQVLASSHTGYKVKICDRDGTEVARGHVVMDSTSGMCHGRRVLPRERKVYVEEVLIGNALVYDGPQDGNSTLEGFIGGGYVIWHEARLNKV